MEESTSTLEKKPPGTIYDTLLTEGSSEPSRQLPESFIGIRHIASGQIKIVRELAFGEVYQGKWKNKLVALKKVDIKHAEKYFKKIYSDNDNALRREHIIEILQWEIGRLSTAIHPNIVPFYGLYKPPMEVHTYMVMAFCSGGTLDSALAEQDVPWHKRWQWAREITRGLYYLHDKGMLHRDLKAENILIDDNGCGRLADLGLAQADSLLIAQEAKLVALGVKDNRYIAPETFKNATVSTPATDIYALGLVFWQLACGKRGEKPQPRRLKGEGFNGKDEKEWMKREPIPEECPAGFKQLILDCWALDPQQRPTAKVVLEILNGLAKDPDIAPPAPELLTLCDKLTLLVQEKRLEALNYLPPFLTDHRLVESVEDYWKSWENSPKDISFSNPPLNLFKTLHNFVESKTATSLLLLGEAGSGKTLSIYLLADALLSAWYAYMNAPERKKPPAYFPLFVRPAMSAWTQAALQKEGFEQVLNYYGLPKHVPFGLLLILDGYDECQPSNAPIKNLSLHLGIPDNLPVKLITTCRPNTVLPEEQHTYFAHRGELQIRHFLGFNDKQLFTSLFENLGWNKLQKKLFMEAFAQASELSHALRNPFVLHLFIESFEALKDKDLRTLKRWQIYDAAVSEWLRKNQALLNPDVQKRLAYSHASLKDSFDVFAGHLAFTAFRQKKLSLTHEEAEKGEFLWAQLPHLLEKEGHNSFVSYTLALYRFEGDMFLSEKDKLIWCNKKAKEKSRKLSLPALIQWHKQDKDVSGISGIKRASSAGGLEGYSVYGLNETGECQLTSIRAEILPADLYFGNGDGKESLLVSPVHYPDLYDTLQSLKAHCKKAERRSLLNEGTYLQILVERIKQFRADCPLKVRLEGYEFIHKSFFEYFAARYLLTLCHLPPEEIQNKATELLADRHLTTEPEILAFWIEGWQVSDYQHAKVLIDPLFAVIVSSKNCLEKALSASNAATLLAKVRIPFVNKDLQDIHIPKADLSRAVFSLSNFSRANLRGVNFRATCLAGVNFTEADMTGVKFGEWATLKGTGKVHSICYSPDGRYLAIAEGKDIGIFEKSEGDYERIHTLTGHTKLVTSVAYSPDGSQLASGSDDKTVRRWDVKSGKPIQTLTGHTHFVNSVAYSPDGSQLVSGSWDDRSVCQWDVKSGKALQTLTGHTSFVTCVAYSPDGSQLASGSWDKSVRQWDVKSAKALQTLTGHTDHVTCVVYSPDGSQLVSGSSDNTVRQWDVKSGKALQTLTGHTSFVTCVAYSPDGSQLASGSWDKSVRQWDVKSTKALQTLTGYTDHVTCVVYSPDGSQLASGSDDGAIFIWQRVKTVLQIERWVIQYRLSRECALLAQEVILHNTIISKSNAKLLEQRGTITDYNYDEAIRFNLEYAIAYYNRGLDKANLGQYEAAIANFNEALRLNPKGINVYCSRGLIKYNLGRYGEAIADYNQVLVIYPNDMFCLLGKAFCYLFQNNLFLAKALFQQVIEQGIADNKDNIVFMQKYFYIGLFFIEWVTQEERHEIVDSSFYEIYESLSSPLGKIELSCNFLSHFFLHAVESKYVTNPNKIGYTLDKIILFMEKVTESLPNEFLPPYYMAKLLLLKGETARAKDFLSLSLKISPQNTLAIKLNASFERMLLHESGITGKPNHNYFSFSERSSQIFAGFFTVFSEVGRQLTRYLTSRDKQAIGCMNRSSYAFFRQEDAKRLYQQATGYWDSREYEQAIRYFRLAATKGYAEAQFSLGMCYQQGLAVAQDLIKAVAYYQKASQQGHANARDKLDHLLKTYPELSVPQTGKSIQFE